jgi:hypothetical protein
VRYTLQWAHLGEDSYDQTGHVSTATNHAVYGYQGNGSAVGNPGGNTISIWRHDYGGIQAALAGATVVGTYVYAKNVHSYLNSGVTARIGTHSNTGQPATAINYNLNRWGLTVVLKGGGAWSGNLGTTLGNEFKSGVTRGLTLGGVNTLNDYAYFSELMVKIVFDK